MSRLRSQQIRRSLKVVLVSLLSIVCVLVLLPCFAISAYPFPNPSGKWQVGTSDIVWEIPNQPARLAKIWYPTNTKNGKQSPYIDRITLEVALSSLVERLHLPHVMVFFKFYLSRSQTPARVNARLIQQNELPVVLFSPGIGGINIQNTFHALELASHGFIVVGINHPGYSAVTFLVDGSVVEFNTSSHSERDAIAQQANNLSAVVDNLLKMNSQKESILYQKIDASQIFAFGHSIGGAASFLVCGQDRRLSKCANLDGRLVRFTDVTYTDKKLMLLEADANPTDAQLEKWGISRNYFEALMNEHEKAIQILCTQANCQRLVFKQAKHLNFTDVPLVFKPSKIMGLVGETDSFELLSSTSRKLIDFFSS